LNVEQFCHKNINKNQNLTFKAMGDAHGIIGKSQGIGFDGGNFNKN
jgi:hypothetical protein